LIFWNRVTTLRETLETLSWIAAIVAVPVTVLVAWFTSGKRKNNKSIATKAALAISGDVRADAAHIVTGHNKFDQLDKPYSARTLAPTAVVAQTKLAEVAQTRLAHPRPFFSHRP